MINANEVRIGNWFNRDFKGIGDINIRVDEKIMGEIFSERLEYALNDLKPILLTQKILNKIMYGVNPQPSYCPDFSIKGHWLPKEDYPYVHQLQNLYFAITGDELNIEL
jgi:hypothetical protein